MREIELVKKKADELGYTNTKMQYILMSKIMAEDSIDISPEDCKRICNLQRYCRMVLNSDEVAMELESKWHNTPRNVLFEVEARQTINRLNGEKII